MPNINHQVISEYLLSIGFSQPIKGKNGCYVNSNSTIVYYSANNAEKPIYTVCHKFDRWEFTEINQLNIILKSIGQKIKKNNHEIIHSYVAENARD